jgi:hypothetical protein
MQTYSSYSGGGQPGQKVSEIPISTNKLVMEVHACHSSYTGGMGRRIKVQGWPPGKNTRPYLKIKAKKGWGHDSSGGTLLSKHKSPSSHPSTTKKKMGAQRGAKGRQLL